MNRISVLLLFIIIASVLHAQTLEECQQTAEQNYPLIRRYGLIDQTTRLTKKNIRTGWFPKVSASAQATLQSDVMSWPDSMKGLLSQMGVEMKGVRKDQYKVGLDIQQPIYDGGEIKAQGNLAQQQGSIEAAQTSVNIYNVRKRVNEMYFALLLIDEQIKLNEDVKVLLASNEKQLSNMVKSGIAATSDLDNVTAERMSAEQREESMKAQRATMQKMLSLFCGIEVRRLTMPDAITTSFTGNNRPELILLNSQINRTQAQEKLLNSQIRPKIGVFAQGYYGYPGFNMLEDMMNHNWSLNGIIGVKLSWNIGALYTYQRDKTKLQIKREQVENERDVFLFNNKLELTEHDGNIIRYRNMMQQDNEIIILRTRVRKAAESKLNHGIIDVNNLLREINNENAAKTQQSIHRISMLKEMYDLKYTINE
jgi:outer membrane protein TolC